MSHECAQIWISTSFDSDFLLYFGKLGHKNIKELSVELSFSENPRCGLPLSLDLHQNAGLAPLSPLDIRTLSVNWPVSKLYSQQVSSRIKHRNRARASSIFGSGVVCVLMPSTRACQICVCHVENIIASSDVSWTIYRKVLCCFCYH